MTATATPVEWSGNAMVTHAERIYILKKKKNNGKISELWDQSVSEWTD